MEVIIPILALTGLVSFGLIEAKDTNVIIEHKEIKDFSKENNLFLNYEKKKAEKPVLNYKKDKEPFVNTTIINNPGFKPVIDNLYFFKNYYQLSVKKYKIETNKIITEKQINLSIDSPKMIDYRDGYQFDYENANYFDGIIIRAQLLPITDKETQFRLIYEIETTDSILKKSDFSKKDGNNVLNELVDEEFSTYEKYKIISQGYHVYTQRVYSLDEKIININKPFLIDIGSYRLELNVEKGMQSDLFYNAKNINCKNEICEIMKSNTIKKNK